MRMSAYDLQAVGPEPIFKGLIPVEKISTSLNWYNYNYEVEELRKFLDKYVEKNYNRQQLASYKKMPDSRISFVDCSIAKMIDNGTTFPTDYMERLKGRIIDYINRGALRRPAVDKTEAQNALGTIRDRMIASTVRKLNDFDDEFIAAMYYGNEFDMYKWMTNNGVSGKGVSMFQEHLQDLYDEYDGALNETDDDLVHAYRHLSSEDLERRCSVLEKALEDCDRFSGNKTLQRKPKKKKTKSTDAIVSKLKYCPQHDKLKLVSVQPHQIVGADILWVYNHKYRVITMYVSEQNSQLSIKRSSVVGFDEAKSMSKKVRKPEETLASLLGGSKPQARKLVEQLKSKGEVKIPSGRINEDLILLRVAK